MVRELSKHQSAFLFDCCVVIARFVSLSCYSSAKTRIRPVKLCHLQWTLGGWITCGSVSGWQHGVGVGVMGIDSPFGWRGGSGGGIVLFELLDGNITQEFVDVGRKKDGAMRPSGVGSASKRGRDRLPRGNSGDRRRPIEVGSVDLVEFLSWHVNATIGGA